MASKTGWVDYPVTLNTSFSQIYHVYF